jgi:hypothetical protein
MSMVKNAKVIIVIYVDLLMFGKDVMTEELETSTMHNEFHMIDFRYVHYRMLGL